MTTPVTTTETGLTILEANRATLTQLVLVNMPPQTTEQEAQRMALKEIANFEMLAQTNPSLLSCTPRSALLAVKQCICDNLTLAPSAGLVYLVPGQVKVGQNGNQDIYEWVINYSPTANGLLSIARQSGRILDHKRPDVVFDAKGAVAAVTVAFLVPSHGSPRWETITFTAVHFEKWRNASQRKNKTTNKPNENYLSWRGGIDPEFAGTKAIKHGLGKLGTNMNEVNRPQAQGTAAPIPPATPKLAPSPSIPAGQTQEEADEITPHQEISSGPTPTASQSINESNL